MTIKNLLGIILVVLGVLSALFVGVWYMLLGGIIQIVGALRSNPIPPLELLWGLIRFSFSWVAGWAVAVSIVGYGFTLLDR